MIISVNKAILHVCCVMSGEMFMSNAEAALGHVYYKKAEREGEGRYR